MANHTTGAQRANARYDKIFAKKDEADHEKKGFKYKHKPVSRDTARHSQLLAKGKVNFI